VCLLVINGNKCVCVCVCVCGRRKRIAMVCVKEFGGSLNATLIRATLEWDFVSLC